MIARILSIGERQWVTIALFVLAFFVIGLMAADPSIRRDDLFKVLAQAIVLTAVVNGIVAFHFSSNKGAETARDNTRAAFEAITATAAAVAPAPALDSVSGAQAVANGAQDAADKIAGDTK